jgi:stage III sporulation protein AA
MNEVLEGLCGGSLYAHGDTIKNGFISLFGGIRAGVCGRAAIDNGRVIGISEISSICIRIPHFVSVSPAPVLDLLRVLSYSKGVLIYSPPGEGKTTLLRSVALEASRTANLRVVVVDSRGELEYGIRNNNSAVDILTGYPKSLGIEIALRTLNASLIICDEIGNEDEARSIIDVSIGGAALVASAHASDISSLMAKKSIRLLHDHGVFGTYVGIKRQGEEYIYTVTFRDEVKI